MEVATWIYYGHKLIGLTQPEIDSLRAMMADRDAREGNAVSMMCPDHINRMGLANSHGLTVEGRNLMRIPDSFWKGDPAAAIAAMKG